MKEIYLLNDTKYLTNQGMKTVDDFDKETMLAIVDKFGNLIFTKDFEIFTNEYKSMYISSDEKYNTLISSCEVEYENHCGCLKQREPKPIKFYLDDDLVDGATEDYVLALSIYVSNFFKKTFNDELIQNGKPTNAFKVLSQYNSLFGVYFRYDNYTKTYRFKSESLYAEPFELENTLLKYRDIFTYVLEVIRKTNMSYGGSYKKIGFNNYKSANMFQVLLALCGYRTRLKFDNDKKLFEVTYTNQDFKFDFNRTTEYIHFKSPHSANFIRVNNLEGKLIISQNYLHNTTVSLISTQSSYS